MTFKHFYESNSLQNSKLLMAIDLLKKEYGQNNLWAGNCGMFSYALFIYFNEVLNIPLNLGLIYRGDVENLMNIDEADVYHVWVELDNTKYDASGKINNEYLLQFAEEEYGDQDPGSFTNIDITEKEIIRKIIYNETNWNTEWTTFYNTLKKAQITEMKIDPRFENFGDEDEEGSQEIKKFLELRRLQKGGWKKLAEEQYKDFKLELYNKKNMYEVFVTDSNDRIVGQTEAQKRPHKGVEQYPQVHFTFVYKPFHGRGIGYQMHRLLIDTVGGITSDFTLTDGSYKLFKKLMNDYNVSIYDENGTFIPFQSDEHALENKNRIFVATKPN